LAKLNPVLMSRMCIVVLIDEVKPLKTPNNGLLLMEPVDFEKYVHKSPCLFCHSVFGLTYAEPLTEFSIYKDTPQTNT
jgi:hypothetical protein